MTKEQSYFLKIIENHLKGEQTKPDTDIDWSIIFEYAKNHQLSSIVYYQCKDFIPAEYIRSFNKQYSSALYYYTNRVVCMKKIEQKFSKQGIEFFTVKGLDVATYYPKPALRTMGDSDIVIHLSDKEKADKLLLDMGFTNHSKGEFEWVYFKNDLEFELHHNLLYDQVASDIKKRTLTDRVWEFTTEVDLTKKLKLNDSFHFMFLLIHLQRHIIHMGVGFRQFMDLVVFSQNAQLDIDWLTFTLKEIDLYDFALTSMAFCEKWFGIKMPISKSIENEFFELATERVFSNGVFGFRNEENSNKLALYGMRKKSKLRIMLNLAFPSYSNVKEVKYYSFVNGKPYLLPAVWVYRYYRMIRYGADDKRKDFANNVIKNDKNKDYDNYLKNWGL